MSDREIRFRAWDKTSEIMHYGGFSVHATGKIEALEGLGPIEGEIMQFVGITDVNGKHVYEGDIFTSPHDFGPAGWADRQGVVPDITDRQFLKAYWDCDHLEVVGNIHEDPGLLQTKDTDQ